MTVAREPVGRAIQVLAWIADHLSEPLVVRKVARDLDTSPSTIHRIFGTFEDRLFISRDENGSYVIGLELYRLCALIADRSPPARIVHAYLQELSAECSENALFGAYDPDRGQMMFIDRVEVPHPVRYTVEPYRWMPVHAGASGLAILAFLSADERQLIYKAGLDAVTPDTIVSVPDLEAELERIRQRGYAHSIGQRVPGAVAFAAPVFDSTGVVCGDICVTLPIQRFRDGDFADSLAATLVTLSQRVTRDLKAVGYHAAAHTARDAS